MPGPVTCGSCGRTVDHPPLTWSLQRDPAAPDPGAPRWLCEECARRHVRSIEARLDEIWW